MSSDKSSSSIILDIAWGELDIKEQGFIYAKDFPDFVNIIENLIHRSTNTNEQSLLSESGKNVIDIFAKEKEFFKIYRDEFKEIFYGLVGKTFKESLKNTFKLGTIAIDVAKEKNILPENFSPLPPVDKIYDETDINQSPRNITRKVRNLENQISVTNDELKFKDDIIIEKDREIIQLTRKLSEYKDKYDYLQREFSFYKGHSESPNNKTTSKIVNENNDGDNGISSDLTKNEFIISELKRKLQEQMIIMIALRDELQSDITNNGKGFYYPSYYSLKNLSLRKLDNIRFIMTILGSFGILLFIIIALIFHSSKSEDDNMHGFMDPFKTSWWDWVPIFNGLGWFYGEHDSMLFNNDHYYTTSASLYNHYFSNI